MTKERVLEVLKENLKWQNYTDGNDSWDTELKETVTEAVKLIEQQPSDDCVSRKAVLDCLTATGLKKFDFILDAREKVNNLPPVTPTQSWIHVSEKLPEDRDWYLGIFKESDTGWINPLPFICDYVGRETKATTKEFWILRGITDMDNPCDYYKNLECVAWQPLPQPYCGADMRGSENG